MLLRSDMNSESLLLLIGKEEEGESFFDVGKWS